MRWPHRGTLLLATALLALGCGGESMEAASPAGDSELTAAHMSGAAFERWFSQYPPWSVRQQGANGEPAGYVVFDSAPVPADDSRPRPSSARHFAVGEKIYATVFLPEPMASSRAPDLEASLDVEVTTGPKSSWSASFASGSMGLHMTGDTKESANQLGARSLRLALMTTPFPSTEPEMDLRNDVERWWDYQEIALRHEPFAITVVLKTSTWRGQVTKVLAAGTAFVDPAADAEERLIALRDRVRATHRLPPSVAPELDLPAMSVVQRYIDENRKTEFNLVKVAVTESIKDGRSGELSAALRRPDGTCLVQPGIRFNLGEGVKSYVDWPRKYERNVNPRSPEIYEIDCSAVGLQDSRRAEADAAKATVTVSAPGADGWVPEPAKDAAPDAPPSLGPATAKVTIVEFADFQCPFCAAAEATLAQLRVKYGARIRLVWRNDPLAFHLAAEPAAELALEARAQKGETGFWAAHGLLLQNAKALKEEDLAYYAAALKLDVARAKAAIAGHSHQAAIAEDQKKAAALGITGTPTFVINGHMIVGAQPIEAFEKVIDAELAR